MSDITDSDRIDFLQFYSVGMSPRDQTMSAVLTGKLPPWPQTCGTLLADGTPRRCCRLICGTAGDQARDVEFPHATCARCGQTYLRGANRIAANLPAFHEGAPLYERDDVDVLAYAPPSETNQ